MPSQLAPHVVLFPFMAQGHILPLLDLAKALSVQNIKVTIITTPSNAKSIAKHVAHHSNVHIIKIPFPITEALPKGCENTAQLPSMELYVPFLHATMKLQKPFHQVLQSLVDSETPPICVISDFFLGWTLHSCQLLGVPRLVFHGMSVLSMAICKTVWVHAPQLKVASVFDPLDFPGLNLPFTLTTVDLPVELINAPNPDDPLTQFFSEVGEADVKSWGIIVNSFEELDGSYVPCFESFYMNGAKAWCLGPLFLYENMENQNPSKTLDPKDHLTQWFTEQTLGSVIYVSFGTQADVSDPQLDEVAFGLVESGIPFIWVVRSKSWALPSEIEVKIKGNNNKALIIKDWVDQRLILSHRAIGGFMSHCGWNSMLESVSAGVPILAWPMIAEQSLNAKFVVDGLGAGLHIKKAGSEGLVSRHAISEAVRELMGGDMGTNARERAQALSRVARRAVQQGGSSHDNFSKLINQLCTR